MFSRHPQLWYDTFEKNDESTAKIQRDSAQVTVAFAKGWGCSNLLLLVSGFGISEGQVFFKKIAKSPEIRLSCPPFLPLHVKVTACQCSCVSTTNVKYCHVNDGQLEGPRHVAARGSHMMVFGVVSFLQMLIWPTVRLGLVQGLPLSPVLASPSNLIELLLCLGPI